MSRKRRGFTLIELLIVASIIGIIVAIAIPNLLNSIQRARQKRTMGDLRAIATAAEAYATDYYAYPPSAGVSLPIFYGGIGYPTATVGERLVIYVAPTYLKVIPLADGWNSWFLFSSTIRDYTVVSAGKNGTPDLPPHAGPTTSFNMDIVFSDGQFTVYPIGAGQALQ